MPTTWTAARPLDLEGRTIRLVPLAEAHAADLCEVGRDPSIWSHMPHPPLASVEDALAWIRTAQAAQREGTDLPFAIVERSAGTRGSEVGSGRAIGSTRYLDIRPAHRGLEIGWTWIGVAHQRTPVNTECKRLLLAHAFETLGALRVQLKTDARNVRSQRAIERIGATREGVLRAHMVMPDGFVRDTVMYSITAGEWNAVKRKLEDLEARYRVE